MLVLMLFARCPARRPRVDLRRFLAGRAEAAIPPNTVTSTSRRGSGRNGDAETINDALDGGTITPTIAG
jgi:hypothetical protein